MYYGGVPRDQRKLGNVDTSKYPGSEGLTLELCAGIVDKTKDLALTAKEEVLEECGYEAPLESFEKVLKYRCGFCTVSFTVFCPFFVCILRVQRMLNKIFT